MDLFRNLGLKMAKVRVIGALIIEDEEGHETFEKQEEEIGGKLK